jgi:UDP-N-acetylmuramoyl-L-alanyl-D-glutamate--2,6-diaminopimelate ligase
MRCIGVTGTNGKTTTTFLVQGIARAAGEHAAVAGTTGVRVDDDQVATATPHTTPEATDLQALLARMRDRGVQTVALEISSHALAQHRVDGTWFAAAGFTNLSHEHLDFHGSHAAYFDAKAALFRPERCAAVATNRDDAAGRKIEALAREHDLPVVTYGLEDRTADVGATGVVTTPTGNRFRLVDRARQASVEVHSPLVGRHNVANALAAAALGVATGYAPDVIAMGLCAPIQVPGRFERVGAPHAVAVFVDYAHTPDALAQALAATRSVAATGRVLVVFGCGGDRDRAKRPLMGAVAGRGADLVVLTSDNPRSEPPEGIAAEVQVGLDRVAARYEVELDRRLAIRRALELARPGDAVLIAGKGHETTQEIGGELLPFDDRVVAAEELARCD